MVYNQTMEIIVALGMLAITFGFNLLSLCL
jgi:hypothetical protein